MGDLHSTDILGEGGTGENSRCIAMFLNFLKAVQLEYHAAKKGMEEADAQTQDILHRLELFEDSPQDMAKLAGALAGVRQNRRRDKDLQAVSEPVVRWLGQNQKVKNSLEQLLGEVRKEEKRMQNRHYLQKTDILGQVFKETKESSSPGKVWQADRRG